MDIQADPSFRSPNDPARRANGSAGAGISVSLKVNGTPHALTLDPRTTILDLVREHLELTGTKKGCDQGQCGACTVLIDGRRVNSCLTFAVMYDGAEITTVEGLAVNGALHPLQQAFIHHDALPGAKRRQWSLREVRPAGNGALRHRWWDRGPRAKRRRRARPEA
jgi:succinate dehydrogenase/fumarate reductase-like Fe-S protein